MTTMPAIATVTASQHTATPALPPGPPVPILYTLPVAIILIAALLTHLLIAVPRTTPPSRRRIRRANGYVMLTVVPLVTLGFSGLDPRAKPGPWLLIWIAATALLALAVALAFIDAANTIRLHRRDRARLVARSQPQPTPTSAATKPTTHD